MPPRLGRHGLESCHGRSEERRPPRVDGRSTRADEDGAAPGWPRRARGRGSCLLGRGASRLGKRARSGLGGCRGGCFISLRHCSQTPAKGLPQRFERRGGMSVGLLRPAATPGAGLLQGVTVYLREVRPELLIVRVPLRLLLGLPARDGPPRVLASPFAPLLRWEGVPRRLRHETAAAPPKRATNPTPGVLPPQALWRRHVRARGRVPLRFRPPRPPSAARKCSVEGSYAGRSAKTKKWGRRQLRAVPLLTRPVLRPPG